MKTDFSKVIYTDESRVTFDGLDAFYPILRLEKDKKTLVA